MMKRIRPSWILIHLITFFYATTSSQAQNNATCFCGNLMYEFQFDFSLTCPPNDNISQGAGTAISNSACLVAPLSLSDVDDEIPIVVTSVEIIEFGPDGDPINVLQQNQDFGNDDTITWTSSNSTKTLQIEAIGRNSAGQLLVNRWDVTYSGNCSAGLPFQAGDSIGWMVYVNGTPPPVNQCPLAMLMPQGLETIAPTAAPSDTFALSQIPSTGPTTNPVTPQPTTLPTSLEPTAEPTTIAKLTPQPTAKVATSPPENSNLTVTPTQTPTKDPTKSASDVMSYNYYDGRLLREYKQGGLTNFFLGEEWLIPLEINKKDRESQNAVGTSVLRRRRKASPS